VTGAVMDADEFLRRRRAKNIALGLAIAGLAVLFFIITIVRIGGAMK
jgi:hypothetical protein